MKLGPPCPHCGARELNGVWLSRTQARLYELARLNADIRGITGMKPNLLGAHLHALNQKLEVLGLRVMRYRLTRITSEPNGKARRLSWTSPSHPATD